jgi:putative peptidoglycan lipid II flippase
VSELASVGETDAGYSRAVGIAKGAGIIAGFTMLARILGLVRTLVFSQTVGATCLGTAYFTANQVPNIVYELVLGGALGSAMVPVLARSAERSGTDPAAKTQVSLITSALLTWTLVILVPLTLIVGLAAGPISSLLTPVNPSVQCSHADLVAITATMLRAFAPQALLYGLTVVLFGLLQAYRRFAGYALAPLVASLVLIASYLAFAPLGRGQSLASLSSPAQFVLAGGATIAVAAMVLVGLLPTWRLKLRLRPAFRFPPGIARRAGGLVMVGLIEVIVQQAGAIAVIALANGRGETGALVMFNYASQVFNSLNAVLALSIVLSAFPVLSARDGSVFDRTCAGSTRAVLLVACLGVAVIGAVAVPAAHVLAARPGQVTQLVAGFALFAPGLLGLGVIANLTRALLAIGRLKVACAAVAGSSLLAALAQVILAEVVSTQQVVAALALGNSIGVIGAAIPLVFITRRLRSRAAVEGVGRATLTGLAAAVAGTIVGVAVSVEMPTSGKLLDAVTGLVAVICAVLVFGGVAFVLDDGDLRVIVTRLRRAAGLRRGLGKMLRTRITGRTPVMNTEEKLDHSHQDAGRRPARSLTLLERRFALAIGTAAGVAGGCAVFVSSNQAGTALLLLIALVFLVIGLEGTPLLRSRRNLAADNSGSANGAQWRSDDQRPVNRGGTSPAASEPDLAARTRAGAVSYSDEVMAAFTDELQQ